MSSSEPSAPSRASDAKSIWILNSSKNFNAWKQVIRAQLEFKELWDVVSKPAKVGEERKDREALFILKQALEPSELEKTGICTSSHELWKKIQENYEGSRQNMVATVSAEWANFRGRPAEELISYCGRFESLVSKLAAVDYVVPEDQKFHFLLRSLPEKRKEFCHTWRMCNPSGAIGDLVSALKARYHTGCLMEGDDEDVALLSSSDVKQKSKSKGPAKVKPSLQTDKKTNEGVTCRYCKKPGHAWKQCFKLARDMEKGDEDTLFQVVGIVSI